MRVAIASTKCLTKIACELLKGDERYEDVLDLTAFSQAQLDQALAHVAVEEIWGIGSKYAQFLRNYGIATAKDVRDVDERWIKRHLTVVGARIQAELKGISCFPLEEKRPPKREIICAKSFGRAITSQAELEEAISTYTARVAEKLREQDSLAGQITVFARTNPFATNIPHYANSFTVDLHYPTAFTPELLKQARTALHAIYRDGYHYDKAGVTLGKITPLHLVQPDLFGEVSLSEHYHQARLMAVVVSSDDQLQGPLLRSSELTVIICGCIDAQRRSSHIIVDAINRIFGRGTLVFATQGLTHNWRMRQERLSQRYTTRREELLTV